MDGSSGPVAANLSHELTWGACSSSKVQFSFLLFLLSVGVKSPPTESTCSGLGVYVGTSDALIGVAASVLYIL